MSQIEAVLDQIRKIEQLNNTPPGLEEVCKSIVNEYKDTLVSLTNDKAGTLARITEDAMQSQIEFTKKHQEDTMKEALRMSLMQKQKHFEESKKAIAELCRYGQEPKKPLEYCRYGHVIFVSTCKYHHKELPGMMKIKFEQTIDLMKKEKLLGIRLNQLNPKDWLIKKYTRFFWLDYKERIK